MIQKPTAERVLSRALETGGDFAEIYLEDTRSNALVLLNGDIERANSSHRHGAGIRVYRDLFSVYVQTTETDEAHLLEAAARAA
ncbi:MAG: TldD/PmbA family protein, partial [Clostridia bacterium]|nr:TldD/PmbA family protein [Clostridia bacterium]